MAFSEVDEQNSIDRVGAMIGTSESRRGRKARSIAVIVAV
jgi:hypothetical protein